MQSYIIGTDIGTGSAKAVACTPDCEVIATSQFYYPLIGGQEGITEQDPEIIWQAFINTINKIISTLGYPPQAVSFSSCMHSLMCVNKKGKALTRLITWADTRSQAIAEEIRKSSAAENLYKATGTPIHAMSPLCKIIWLQRNQPEVYKETYKFISIKEFIWHRLFNEYETDHSIASATGLFDIEKLEWYQPSLQLCRISAEALSVPVSTDYKRNDINEKAAALLNIPPGTIFCIGSSDGCLASLGSYAINSDTGAITIGTSGAVRIAVHTPLYDFSNMLFNYILDKDTFISGGSLNNGGNILPWLFKTFLDIPHPINEDYDNLFKMIDTINTGADGLLFLPYINAERAPVWDEKASGIFIGVKTVHTKYHFCKAALEGVCYTLKNILELTEQLTMPVKRLNVSGGFVHSKTWMQMLADITNKQICLVQSEDASSVGAAILAMKAVGMITRYSMQKKEYEIINPNTANSNIYEKYFTIFKDIYKSTLASMHAIYAIHS